MKQKLLISFIITCSIAFGQSVQNKINIDTIKTIILSQIPDNEIVFIDNDIVIRFSRKLILNNIDKWINLELTPNDTSKYPVKDIKDIKGELEEVRSIYSNKSCSKFIYPITYFKKHKKKVTQSYISDAVRTDILFNTEIICPMIENGEFECILNGHSLTSIIYAEISKTDSEGIELTRECYLVGNKYEIKFCWVERPRLILE